MPQVSFIKAWHSDDTLLPVTTDSSYNAFVRVNPNSNNFSRFSHSLSHPQKTGTPFAMKAFQNGASPQQQPEVFWIMVITMTTTTANIELMRFENRHTEGRMTRLIKTAGTIFVLVLVMAASVYASPRTLIDTHTTDIGGFGAPTAAYSTFNGEDAMLVGGQGAMLINQGFYIGGGGYGMASRHRAPSAGPGTSDSRFEFGYGGILLGMMHNSDRVVHMASDVLIGAGAVVNTYYNDYSDPHYTRDGDWDDGRDYSDDPFFVVQPMVHVEVNILKFWRVGFSGGYRFVDGVNSFGLNDSDLSGPVAGMTFRFGKF